MDSKGQMISSERGEAEKQRTPMSSPPTPSKHLPIYLHLLTSGDSHGFYYAIEEKGKSPVPQYRRPRVETSVAEEVMEYAASNLNLNHDEEDEDEDDEDIDDCPVREANDEAKAEVFCGGVPAYKPSARPAASAADSEEEPPPRKSKPVPMEDQSGQVTTDNYSKKTKEGEILVIYPSETDTIRPLQFPDLPLVPFESDLLLVGERFFFIGGYNVPKSQYGFMDDFPPTTNMFFWDSDVDKAWKLLPAPNVLSSNDHHPPSKAAVWAAGTFVVMGNSLKERRHTFRGLSSGDTAWKTLPRLPDVYISRISIVNPLAVNGSKIFFQVNGHVFLRKYRKCPVHMAAYFDVESWQWEIVGTWFPGVWSPGVLLYDAYLFSYGSTKPDLKKSDICVYSIKQKCWLRRPVRGLKRDGNVLPDDLSEELSRVAAYLFQVKDNVLAFVWSRSPVLRLKEEKELSDVHCTKFILHCIKDPRKKHPVFRAEVISYGNWLVEGQQLQNCLVNQSVRT